MKKIRNVILACFILFLFSIGNSESVNAQSSTCKWQQAQCSGGTWWNPGKTYFACLQSGDGFGCTCGQVTDVCDTLSDFN